MVAMKTNAVIYGLALVGSLMSACQKDDSFISSAPATNENFAYSIQAINPTVELQQNAGIASSIVWNSGIVSPRFVKLTGLSSTSRIDYRSVSTSTVDLFAPISEAFGGYTLPLGSYNEVELKVLLDKHDGIPALELKGQYISDLSSTPVKLVVNDMLELKTEQRNITISDNSNTTLMTYLDLAGVTQRISDLLMKTAKPNAEGVIEISSTSNARLYSIIVNDLRTFKFRFKDEKNNKEPVEQVGQDYNEDRNY